MSTLLPELTHATLPQIVQRAVDRYGDRIVLEKALAADLLS